MKAKRSGPLSGSGAQGIEPKPTQATSPIATSPEGKAHALLTYLSLAAGSKDPLAPPAKDWLELVSQESYWPSLAHHQGQPGLFPTLDELKSVDYEWHQFLCGPMQPFLVALGLTETHDSPEWAVMAAREVQSHKQPAQSSSHRYAFGWCLGLGGESRKLLAEWKVRLLDYAQPSRDLTMCFFARAAELAESDLEGARGFYDGYFDGRQAIKDRESGGDGYVVPCLLYMIMKREEFQGVCRPKALDLLRKRRLLTADARHFQQILAKIGFPRGKPGPKPMEARK